MAKRLNKTKLIKKYFGDVIKEYGFEYSGADAWTWNFFRQKEDVKQEIIIMRHRFFADQIKLMFYTGVYRWGDQAIPFIPPRKCINICMKTMSR